MTSGYTAAVPTTPTRPDLAAIFDLDGLLIDSEPIWVQAEVEVLGALGVPLVEADCARTTGLRIDEVVAWWSERHPWTGPGVPEVAERIVAVVERRMRAEGQPREGACEAVARLASFGPRLGLASSSPRRLIEVALDRLGLADAFEVVASGQDQPLGKPHPGVYLAAAAALGLPPTRCVAVEDSVNGLVAAAAARMACIVVPAPIHLGDPRLGLADLVLPGLPALTRGAWDRLLARRGLSASP
ncbi:hexitol phosphatase HxpB [Myxococcota bacterium]|nr:hexitol phosphatase HxpB [Myxococcota bacterium]